MHGFTRLCSTVLCSTVAVSLLVFVAIPSGAHAHVAKMSSSRVELSGEGISALITSNVADLAFVLKVPALKTELGEVDTAVLAVQSDRITQYILEKVRVLTEDGQTCTAQPGRPKAYAETVDVEQIRLRVRWTCPEGATGLTYQATLFQEADKSARHIVLITEGEEERQALIDADNTKVPLAESSSSVGLVFVRYVKAGIEHIWIGYDHIAFLLAIILWGRHWWPLVKLVTAFTVAHSITLTLAVLEIVTLPSSFVEAMIAVTIVYVAAENFFLRGIDKRWRMTFALGLFHGLGFASVLRDYGLPSDALAVALASFNIGVEIGQIVIVVIAVSLLILVDKFMARNGTTEVRKPALVYGISIVIGAFGLYWLAQRTGLA